MKKQILFPFFVIFVLALTACSGGQQTDLNMETAIAQVQSTMAINTAVAQMNETLTAAAPVIQTPVGTPQPTPTSSICTLNQPCQAAGIQVTITEVSKAAEVGKYWKADAGSTYLIITVTIKNLERDQSPYNPTWFTVTDSQGGQASGNNYAPLPDLQNGSLAKGGEVSGKVSFLVKEDSGGFKVTYLPADPLGNYSPLNFDLGQ